MQSEPVKLQTGLVNFLTRPVKLQSPTVKLLTEPVNLLTGPADGLLTADRLSQT